MIWRECGVAWEALPGVKTTRQIYPQLATGFSLSFPGGTNSKEYTCQCRRCKRRGFDLWVGKIPWRRKWRPTPGFLPRKSQGQRSLAGYSPWSRKKSDTTEQLALSLSTHYLHWGLQKRQKSLIIKLHIMLPSERQRQLIRQVQELYRMNIKLHRSCC